MRRPVLVLGAIAIVALLGGLTMLPPSVAFFIGAIPIVLFPGITVAGLVGLARTEVRSLPERLAVGFGLGMALLSCLGFAGILFHASLAHLTVFLIAAYVVLMIWVASKGVAPGDSSNDDHLRPGCRRTVIAALACLAIGVALLTLLTPRDNDDWFYLAYITDYVAGHELGLEDAIFDSGQPASPRAWFGGWWVVEALLSKASGGEPVDCNQVYFPVLTVFFSVLSVFTLARMLFQSYETALLGCCFQVLFLVSSAFPTKSAGWLLMCRAAQDKAVCALIVVPVTLALGLGLLRLRSGTPSPADRPMFVMFALALVGSALVHPFGPIWCAAALIPFMVIEFLLKRTRRFAAGGVLVLVVFLMCGGYLLYGNRVLRESYETLQGLQVQSWSEESISRGYLPGTPFPPRVRAPITVVGERTGDFRIVEPSFVLRYPLAIAGALLTLLLIPKLKSSFSARFLVFTTFSVAFLAFTPLAPVITARLMTFRMAYRITWVFPWGLAIALFISTLRIRPRWGWIILLAVSLILARGDPRNYVKSLASVRTDGRPPNEVAQALGALRSEPSPQGWVLASEETGMHVAGFVPDGYPAFYRGAGALPGDRLSGVLAMHEPGERLSQVLRENSLRYMLLERELPLTRAILRHRHNLRLVFENEAMLLWEVPPDFELGPLVRFGPNVVMLTVTSLRRDHVGSYGHDRPTTPEIDRLAERSIVFENAVSPSPQTLPAHASILTGTYPRTHGAICGACTLGAAVRTLAEKIWEMNYLTGAFVNSYELMDSCGLERGFDTYWSLHDRFSVGAIMSFRERGEEWVTDAALDWIGEHGRSPFFLWVQWSHPHRPYGPAGRIQQGPADGVEPALDGWLGGRTLTESEVEEVVRCYDAEITAADGQVGRVMEHLDSAGLLEHTIVILTSDHGEILYDRGDYFGHEAEIYDETIMVPLILCMPGRRGGQSRLGNLVGSIDIMPTILDALNPELSFGMDGRSLLPLVEGKEFPPHLHAFAEAFPEAAGKRPRHAVRTLNYKLIWKQTSTGDITRESYNLVSDPGETVNLYSAGDSVAARLDAVLTGWMEDGGLSPVEIPLRRRSMRYRILRRVGYMD